MPSLLRSLALASLAAVAPLQAAPALETEVLFDGNDLSDWTTSRDQARIDREFSLSQLKLVREPAALQWRFVSKGVAFNDVFLMKPIARPFDAIRILLRNEGEPFSFGAKVRDESGAEWTTTPMKLETSEDWRWIELPRDDWRVASWSRDDDGKLDFPLASLTLIAFGLTAGPEYHLKVQRIEAVRPEPPIATIHELTIPGRLQAGKSATVTVEFSLDKPCSEEAAAIAFRQGKAVLFRAALPLPKPLPQVTPGERVRLTNVEIRVPQYAFGGEHAVTLQLGEARIRVDGKSADQEVRTVRIAQRETGNTIGEVKEHNGTPTLFINGEPQCGMAWATYNPTVEVFSDFTQAGVNLFTFSGTPTEAGYGLSKTTWVAPDEFDYSQFDERVLMLLEANPNAYFFPRLYIHAPKWWSEQHPDDLVLMDPGDGKPVPFIHSGGKPAPSWASETWRRDTVAALKKMVAHIEASPYADRVLGYHIASGTTEEWMMWGGNENQWVDYSPVNVARFREWLAAKYGSDDGLRAAWHDPDVALATAALPTKAQRQATQLGSLRDPAKEQGVIDFYLYNSDLVADTICYFAKAVKDLTKREKMTGFFYGYLLQLCGEQRQQNAGHLGLEKVLASPDVDMLCSPTSYAFRQVGGEGTSHFMSLFGSCKLHGKVWFDENDIRTSVAGGKPGEWGRPENVAGDLLQQDKELANCLVNGAAQWWFDVGGNKYNDPTLMGRIGELTEKAHGVISLDRSPVDEVALIVDEKSLCYLRVGDPLGRWLLVGQLPQLHRIGAPLGHYLVTDLPKLADHKLFFIATSFAPTEADRKAIDALKRDGHVLVFLWAPGIYRDGQLDESAMADLTGIKLRMSREPASLRVTVKPGHALTDGLDDLVYGHEHKTFPIVYAEDPDAKVVGTLDDGRPGLVVKEHGDWTAIHSAAPSLPASLMRRMAELAGVHLYIDTEDVVWATRDLLAVSVARAGKRKIALPREADVRDLYGSTDIAEGVMSFSADFDERATRVFVVE